MALNENMVIVPMQLKVLRVGTKDLDMPYAGSLMNFSMMGCSHIASQMETPPFANEKRQRTGIHLHWILPNTMLHGIQNDKGEIVYPVIPDHWLITRCIKKENRPHKHEVFVKTFLVESNYYSARRNLNNISSNTFPVGERSYFIGRSGELGTLPKAETYIDGLSAVGYGEPSFHMYYPECENVLGFYDGLEDIDYKCEISYQVCGYYAKKQDDPLYDTETDLYESMEHMMWQLQREPEDVLWYGTMQTGDDTVTLCRGLCYDILWNGHKDKYDNDLRLDIKNIAIGNTSAEAMAAMLSKTGDGDERTETILNMFMSDLIVKWTDLDGIVKAEEKLHEQCFEPIQGGNRWILKLKEGVDSVEAFADDESVWSELDRLNILQQLYNEALWGMEELEHKIYFLWYFYQNDKQNDSKTTYKSYEELFQIRIKSYNTLYQQANDLKGLLLQCKEKILEFKDFNSYYTLLTESDERFWKPNDPTILFAGNNLKQDYNDFGGKYTENDYLICRTWDQLVRKVNCLDGNGNIIGCVTEKAWEGMVKGWEFYPKLLKELIVDMLFHSKYAKALIKDDIMLQKQLYMHEYSIKSNASTVLEYSSFDSKKWNPLFLEWSIEFIADEDKKLKGWELDYLDYELIKSLKTDEHSSTYRGRIILTPHFLNSFHKILKEYEDTLTNVDVIQSVKALDEKLGNMDVLSQSLGGFSDYLVMRKPVSKFQMSEIWKEDTQYFGMLQSLFSNEEVLASFMKNMEEHVDVDPIFGTYFALYRAGIARLTHLRLIDSFGRVQNIFGEDGIMLRQSYMVANSFNSVYSNDENAIILPPRIMQPTRLSILFGDASQWIEAALDMDHMVKRNILLGWILPNYADNSLTFYNENGEIYRILYVVKNVENKSVCQVVKPPGATDQVTKELDDIAKMLEKELKSENTKLPLEELINYLSDEIFDVVESDYHSKTTISKFIGKPFALVKVSMRLETKAPFYEKQKLNNSPLGRKEDVKFRWPVRIGNRHMQTDGFIGYFDNDNLFHTYEIAAKRTGYIQYDNNVMLQCNAQYEVLNMLIDPFNDIHFTCGILPVKKVRIPEKQVITAMKNIEIKQNINPVLRDLSVLQNEDYLEHMQLQNELMMTKQEQNLGFAQSWVRVKE